MAANPRRHATSLRRDVQLRASADSLLKVPGMESSYRSALPHRLCQRRGRWRQGLLAAKDQLRERSAEAEPKPLAITQRAIRSPAIVLMRCARVPTRAHTVFHGMTLRGFWLRRAVATESSDLLSRSIIGHGWTRFLAKMSIYVIQDQPFCYQSDRWGYCDNC